MHEHIIDGLVIKPTEGGVLFKVDGEEHGILIPHETVPLTIHVLQTLEQGG